VPSESGTRTLTGVLVALAVFLAVAVVVIVSGGSGPDTTAPVNVDPALVLDTALADGMPVYVLVRSET